MPCQAQRVPKMASLYSHRLRCLRLSSNRSPVQQFAPVGWMSSTCFSTKLPPQSCRENFYVSVGSLSFSASPGAALWPASFPGSSTTGLHERKSSDPSSPHLLRSAQQKRWSRVSSRRAADVPGPKKIIWRPGEETLSAEVQQRARSKAARLATESSFRSSTTSATRGESGGASSQRSCSFTAAKRGWNDGSNS